MKQMHWHNILLIKQIKIHDKKFLAQAHSKAGADYLVPAFFITHNLP